jgi:hypothetical protein
VRATAHSSVRVAHWLVGSLLALLLSVGSAMPAHAQFALRAAHAGAGHAAMSGGAFSLRATAGQPAVRIAGNGQPFYLGTGFWFGGRNASVALPVELAAFTAVEAAEGVALTWQTASETENAGFHVQRQTGTGAFTNVHFTPGAGTTTAPQRYRFTDRSVPFAAETLTYRLRQVDSDGTATLSDAVEVTLGAPTRLRLHAPYPNPARSGVTLRYALPAATDVDLAVYDVLGRRVATLVQGLQPGGRVERRLDTRRLPSGVYFVRLVDGGEVRTQRLTVVR